jgi:hypothetical protein
MPDHDCNNDLADMTIDERQDRTNERHKDQRERLHGRRRELTGKMEWPVEDEE